MTIDFSTTISLIGAMGSIATAFGLIYVAQDVHHSKKTTQAEFEDQFDQQYRALMMPIPVDVLIGKETAKMDKERVRELVYVYLDLTNEQIYMRSIGRVSKATWESWCSGILAHMARPGFREVFEEVRESSNFTYLEQLLAAENYKPFKGANDPRNWSKRNAGNK